MSLYDYEIVNIIKNQLPTRKKEERHTDWLISLLRPLRTARQNFITFRDSSRIELSYNSQTKIFEKLLNDRVDSTLRRIYIDNLFDNKERTYLYNKGEDDTIYLYDISEGKPPTYLYDVSEFALDFDFIIFAPIDLTSEETRIRAIADRIKIAGTRYKIEFY